MFSRKETNRYNDLMNELITKSAVLKELINNRWTQYFPEYVNPMNDIDTWLNQVDKMWAEITDTEEAKARLSESKKMIDQGKLYAKNLSPWLRNISPLSAQDSIAHNVGKSSALIIEHASRRVDFFFLSLIFFYNKSAIIHLDQTKGMGRKLQTVHGTNDYGTQACHSAIVSNFKALSITGEDISIPEQLARTLNTTVELPKRVNDLDGRLEGKIEANLQSIWRKAALKILNQTSQEGHNYEPRKALIKFLLQLVNFFSSETIIANYWSINSPLENQFTYAFQCIGTFYFLWSSKVNLEDYIHSQMRLKLDEIPEFKEKKFFRINKYKTLSSEISACTTPSWLNEFFSMDLTNESRREELSNDDFVLDLLDNLLCFEETFESAMDILTSLVDFDYGFECHIQYRVNLAFSPFLGGISYQQRLTYLKNRLFLFGNEQNERCSLSLILALCNSLKIIVLEETCPEAYSSICEDKDLLWEIPSDGQQDHPSVKTYCLDIVQLMSQAACRTGLYCEAREIITEFIEQNLTNLWAQNEILYKFVISIPISIETSDDFYSNWCESIYYKLKGYLEKIKENGLEDDDSDYRKLRIRFENLLLCITINQFMQLSKNLNLLNAQLNEKYSWYLSLLDNDDEEIEHIVYLYNFFNGKEAWEDDKKRINSDSPLTIFQDMQIDKKIDRMINGSIKIENQIQGSQLVWPSIDNLNPLDELNSEETGIFKPLF